MASYAAALLGAIAFLSQLFPHAFRRGAMAGVALGKMLAFSLPASMARVFASMIMMFDCVLIGLFRPASEVGVYQAASLSASIFPIILVSFNAIFAPTIADPCYHSAWNRLERGYRATRWAVYVSLLFFVLILAAPGELLRGVFGEGYVEGALPLVILATAQFTSVAVGGVGVLLPMTGLEVPWLRLSAGVVLLHVVGSLLLVPRLGIVGGALTTGGAMLCLFLAGLVQTSRRLGLWPYDRSLVKALMAGLAGAGAAILVRQMSVGDPLLKVMVLAVFVAGVMTMVLASEGLEPEERDVLARVKDRVREWRNWSLH